MFFTLDPVKLICRNVPKRKLSYSSASLSNNNCNNLPFCNKFRFWNKHFPMQHSLIAHAEDILNFQWNTFFTDWFLHFLVVFFDYAVRNVPQLRLSMTTIIILILIFLWFCKILSFSLLLARKISIFLSNFSEKRWTLKTLLTIVIRHITMRFLSTIVVSMQLQ